jgi:hypothetical protein
MPPVREQFLPFRDEYILRLADAGKRMALQADLSGPINTSANI